MTKASFDIQTKEGKKRVFNATNGASKALKDVTAEQVLTVNGVLLHEGTNENGEINTVTTLFTTDGEAYAGISATVAKSADGLIDYLQNVEEEVDVKVIKGESKGGRTFFQLQLV